MSIYFRRAKVYFGKHWPTMLVVLMLITGFGLLFYPDVARWWNGRIQRGIVNEYYIEVAQLSPEYIAEHFRRAEEHNAALGELPPGAPLLIGTMAMLPDDYHHILRIGRNHVMARVEVPSADINLPVYHTTTSAVLDRGVGHLEGTAFPIGGYSTHSVLTAHSALAGATMFTNLEDNIAIGDLFFISVLGERLAYRVDQILVVYPHEIDSLRVIPGMDLMTLITCTPYAVNTHRLLVRGHRIPYTPEVVAEAIEAAAESPVVHRVDMRVYVFAAFFVVFILTFIGYQIYLESQNKKSSTPYAPYSPYKNAEAVKIEPQTFVNSDTIRAPAPPTPVSYKREAARTTPYATAIPNYGNRKAPATYPATQAMKKSRKKSGFLRSSGSIAACIVALLLVAGASVIFATQSLSQQADPQGAIANFVSRIEEYRAAHSEQLAAELIDQWLNDGDTDVYLNDSVIEAPLHWLYTKVFEHNHNLYALGQGYLPDPFSNSQESMSLSYFGFEEDMFGFIEIPALDIQMPIYMGANNQNLSRGVAHLTNTSLPIGGMNTNAVIVGYTNQRRIDIFGNIGMLESGDEILITNFYQTLSYSIIDIRITNQNESDHFMIQSGRDRLTLLVYRPESNQRYVVVATRVDETQE